MTKIFDREIDPKWLYLAGFVVLLFFIGFVCWYNTDGYADGKKWSCSESGCELVLGGEYDTEEECKKSGCKLPKKKKVSFTNNIDTYYY